MTSDRADSGDYRWSGAMQEWVDFIGPALLLTGVWVIYLAPYRVLAGRARPLDIPAAVIGGLYWAMVALTFTRAF